MIKIPFVTIFFIFILLLLSACKPANEADPAGYPVSEKISVANCVEPTPGTYQLI